MLPVLGLGLRHWRRQVPRLLLVLKTRGLVGPIAKGLARGVATTAKRDRSAATKTVRLAFHIDELDVPFYAQGTVVANHDFCLRHFVLREQGQLASVLYRNTVTKRKDSRIIPLVLRHPRIDFIRPCKNAALQVPKAF